MDVHTKIAELDCVCIVSPTELLTNKWVNKSEYRKRHILEKRTGETSRDTPRRYSKKNESSVL